MFNHRERLLWQAAYGGLIVWVALSVFCGSATAYAASPQDNGGYQDRTATDPDTQGSGD